MCAFLFGLATACLPLTPRIQELLKSAEGRLGCSLSVGNFVRMAAGEGIERDTKDFAQEVAAVSGVKA
jgi:elongation factor Ts